MATVWTSYYWCFISRSFTPSASLWIQSSANPRGARWTNCSTAAANSYRLVAQLAPCFQLSQIAVYVNGPAPSRRCLRMLPRLGRCDLLTGCPTTVNGHGPDLAAKYCPGRGPIELRWRDAGLYIPEASALVRVSTANCVSMTRWLAPRQWESPWTPPKDFGTVGWSLPWSPSTVCPACFSFELALASSDGTYFASKSFLAGACHFLSSSPALNLIHSYKSACNAEAIFDPSFDTGCIVWFMEQLLSHRP
jgi:hypothetical protein